MQHSTGSRLRAPFAAQAACARRQRSGMYAGCTHGQGWCMHFTQRLLHRSMHTPHCNTSARLPDLVCFQGAPAAAHRGPAVRPARLRQDARGRCGRRCVQAPPHQREGPRDAQQVHRRLGGRRPGPVQARTSPQGQGHQQRWLQACSRCCLHAVCHIIRRDKVLVLTGGHRQLRPASCSSRSLTPSRLSGATTPPVSPTVW